MKKRSAPLRRGIALLTALALLVAACADAGADADPAASPAEDADGADTDGGDDDRASGDTDSDDAAASDDKPAFPRTVETDLGEVTIEAAPQRIVAASTNAAEIALALVGPDRVAAVPEYNLEDRHSPYAAEARAVGATVAGIGSDPEQLLAMDPDLVLITLAHGSEEDALDLLQEAGVPTVALSHHPHVADDAFEDIRLIGEALGAEAEAAAMIDELQERFDAVRALVADSELEPRVVFISMWLDTGPYVTGPGTINHDLVLLAGATNAIEDAGFESSDWLDPEQLVAAAPTHIVTQDPAGDGLAALTAGFLDEPGLAQVPAIAEDRILVLPGSHFSASRAGIEGLEAMAAWLHDPDATTDER